MARPRRGYHCGVPEQYVASDKRSGVEVAVTGEFPPHPDDRMRIARTTTLFTRLTSTLLGMESEAERRAGFRAVETQLELAEALIRRDAADVRRLVRQTIESMGVTTEQLEDLARQLHQLSGLDESTAEEIMRALGLDRGPDDAGPTAEQSDWPPPPEARGADSADGSPPDESAPKGSGEGEAGEGAEGNPPPAPT